jgi:hypothetical protein
MRARTASSWPRCSRPKTLGAEPEEEVVVEVEEEAGGADMVGGGKEGSCAGGGTVFVTVCGDVQLPKFSPRLRLQTAD